MPQFARYIGTDYSGAVTPESSCKGLRVLRCRWHRHAGTGSSLNYFLSRKPVSATPVPPVANRAKRIRVGNHAVPKTDTQVAQSPRETASESSLLQQLFLCLQQSCVASLSSSSSLLSLSKHSPAFDEFAASIWGITLRMPNALLFKHEHGININSFCL